MFCRREQLTGYPSWHPNPLGGVTYRLHVRYAYYDRNCLPLDHSRCRLRESRQASQSSYEFRDRTLRAGLAPLLLGYFTEK